MTDDRVCSRCGHAASEHDNEILVCDELGCLCPGFVDADTFASDIVQELHLGEES